MAGFDDLVNKSGNSFGGKKLNLKSKLVLKKKDEQVEMEVAAMVVKMEWRSDVDMDLMCFGKTRNGQAIEIYSDEMSKDKRTLGDISVFPYIEHTGDEGVSAVGGGVEVIKVASLKDIEYLHFIVLNYTQAAIEEPKPFSPYQVKMQFEAHSASGDKREFEVPLLGTTPGIAALISSVEYKNGKHILINKSDVYDTYEVMVYGPKGVKESIAMFK